MTRRDGAPPAADVTVPHPARINDYWLGGENHFDVDRSTGEQVLAAFPRMRELARLSQRFAERAVRYLVEDVGLRQFLDVGTGPPSAGGTHETAQRVAPETRVVYVDHDPLVLAHADALLAGTRQGAADYLHADTHDPDRVLSHASRTLDLDRPVGVLLTGVLGHIERYDEARAIAGRLMQDLPADSHLVIRDGTDTDEAYRTAVEEYGRSGAVPYRLRSPQQIARYFARLELVDPGVVPCHLWRPDGAAGVPDGVAVPVLGGVARKVW